MPCKSTTISLPPLTYKENVYFFCASNCKSAAVFPKRPHFKNFELPFGFSENTSTSFIKMFQRKCLFFVHQIASLQQCSQNVHISKILNFHGNVSFIKKKLIL
jgi:hypothetical protein